MRPEVRIQLATGSGICFSVGQHLVDVGFRSLPCGKHHAAVSGIMDVHIAGKQGIDVPVKHPDREGRLLIL